MEGMNLQPHLGRFTDNYKPESKMGGYLALAKIIKVHHKMGTADVMIVKTNDALTSGAENEGRFAARIGTSSAHFDRTQMSTSGSVKPVQEGQLVVLAFLDGLKNQPVILISLPDTLDTRNNILPNVYPLVPDNSIEDLREAMKSLDVHPTQFYTRIDGTAGVEVSHPSKSFLKIEGIEPISDSHLGTDHKDLEEKDPNTFNTRSGRTEEASFPVSVLYNHRTSFDDDVTTWTKVFLEDSGLFRITRDNRDEKLTYLELGEEGHYKIRRQLDSPDHGVGDNITELELSSEGDYKIIRKNGNKELTLTITEDGIQLSVSGSTTTTLNITDNNATLSSNGTINLEAPQANIKGDLSITGTVLAKGKVTAQNGFDIQGGLSLSGTTDIQGNVSITGKLLVNGESVVTEPPPEE
jgi:hypothetical protein